MQQAAQLPIPTQCTQRSRSAAGTYNIRVYVKDAKGTKAYKDLTLKATAAASTLKNTSKTNVTTVEAGKVVTITASATGGTKPYQFAVYIKKSTAKYFQTLRAFSTGTTIYFRPASVGTYTVTVKVKDNAGKVVSKSFTVKATAPALVNKTTISATAITLGKSVTITGAAAGGTSPYQYAVFYKVTGTTTWTCIQSFKTNKSVTITPKAATTYTVRVKIKDAKNNVVNKDFTIKVTAELKNLSEISAQKLVKGKNVTVTCSGSGGTAPYTYAVYYKQRSQTSWTCAQSYSSKTVVRISPKAATVYQIRVKLKDASGKIVNKDFTLTVTK